MSQLFLITMIGTFISFENLVSLSRKWFQYNYNAFQEISVSISRIYKEIYITDVAIFLLSVVSVEPMQNVFQ